MKKIDINRKYRQVAIFCAVEGGKNDGRALIPWSVLEDKFGISWQSYTNELHANGMLYSSNGYEYLRPDWAAMTPTERMEQIKKWYPYPY